MRMLTLLLVIIVIVIYFNKEYLYNTITKTFNDKIIVNDNDSRLEMFRLSDRNTNYTFAVNNKEIQIKKLHENNNTIFINFSSSSKIPLRVADQDQQLTKYIVADYLKGKLAIKMIRDDEILINDDYILYYCPVTFKVKFSDNDLILYLKIEDDGFINFIQDINYASNIDINYL